MFRRNWKVKNRRDFMKLPPYPYEVEKLARPVGSMTVAKALNHQLRQQIRYKFKKDEQDPEDVDIVGSDINAAVKAVSLLI